MISILIPCFNEQRFISRCIQSVLQFEVPQGEELEILVLDGNSFDGTREIVADIAQRYPSVRMLDNTRRIQSAALNIGIRASVGEYVMRLDAHARYPKDYLLLCYETARTTGADNVGGVCVTLPGGSNYQSRLVQALTTHRFGVGNSGFRVGAKAGPSDTVPFGFFRDSVFERIGFFDERLVRTQDYEFNRRLKASGGSIYQNPAIRSDYFCAPDLRVFLRKQILLQGPYTAYMWYLAPYAFAPRHAVTVVFALLFWFLLPLLHLNPRLSQLYLAAIAAHLCLGLLAAGQQAIRFRLVRHLACLPVAFFLFHLFHGTGVLLGLLRLATKTSPVQKSREPWSGAGRYRAWVRNGSSI